MVRRVYGNACVVGQWESQPGFKFIHTGSGKNSADMKLAVDAVGLSYCENIERFVIVTSDGDFSHLVYALRERGLHVFGLGLSKAPDRFREACTAFVCLTIPENPTEQKPAFDAMKIKGDGLTNKLIHVVGQEGGGGIAISSLNAIMRRRFEIKISGYAEKTWHGYLSKRTDVFACDPKGLNARVRLTKNARNMLKTEPCEV